jgi:hypothetical protein
MRVMLHQQPKPATVTVWSMLVLFLSLLFFLYTKTSMSSVTRERYFHERQEIINKFKLESQAFASESTSIQLPMDEVTQARRVVSDMVKQGKECMSSVFQANTTCVNEAERALTEKVKTCDAKKSSYQICTSGAYTLYSATKANCAKAADVDTQSCIPKRALLAAHREWLVAKANHKHMLSQRFGPQDIYILTEAFLNNTDIRFHGRVQGMWTVFIETLHRMCIDDYIQTLWITHQACLTGFVNLFDVRSKESNLSRDYSLSEIEYMDEKAKCTSGEMCSDYVHDILLEHRSCNLHYGQRNERCRDEDGEEALSVLICKAEPLSDCNEQDIHKTQRWFREHQESIASDIRVLDEAAANLIVTLRKDYKAYEEAVSVLK